MPAKMRVFAWHGPGGVGEAYLEIEGIEDAATVRAVASLLAATLGISVQNGLSPELRQEVARIIERGDKALANQAEHV